MSDTEENGEGEEKIIIDYEELDDDSKFKKVERQIYEDLQQARRQHLKDNPPGDDGEEAEPFDFDGWLEQYQEKQPNWDVNVIKYVNLYGIYSGERDEYQVRKGEGETWYGNGDRYMGEFKDGQKDGKGLYEMRSQPVHDAEQSVADMVVELDQLKMLLHKDDYSGAVKVCQKQLAEQGKQLSHIRLLYVLQYGPYPFYDGEYRENQQEGQGLMKYPDGKVYRGEWQQGQRHGFGIMWYENGDKYRGEWKDGKKHGKGSYYFKKTGSVYTGEWQDGQMLQGQWDLMSGVVYEGKFQQNQPHDEDAIISFGQQTSLHGQFREGRWAPNHKFTIGQQA